MQYGRFARYTVSYLQQGRATRALRRLPVQQIIAARSERTSSSKADRHVSQRAAAEQPFADNSPWSLRSFRFARRKTFVTHVLQAMTVKEAEKSDILADFHELVNMDAQELDEWLQTPESQNTGMKREGEDEAVGHVSGRRIVEILQKSEDDYTEEDYQHMKNVRSYCKRHMKQRPNKLEEELDHMKWTYSLKNWGHDPIKHEQ